MPRALEALIRRAEVTLVHARSRAPAWSAWLACQRTGVPFVTTYHGAYGEDLPFKRRYNAVMARGRIVIAASQYIADLVMVGMACRRSGSGSSRAASIRPCSIPAIVQRQPHRQAGARPGGCRTASGPSCCPAG